MGTDDVFCFPVTISSAGMGSQKETFTTQAVAFKGSVQEQANNSEQVDPSKPPTRNIEVFTKDRGVCHWHDRIASKGSVYQVISVVDRCRSPDGIYLYTKIKAVFLSEAGSINKV